MDSIQSNLQDDTLAQIFHNG